ncbi:MAG: hypothetical protein AAF682_29095 [Planctomycetota bacterium]
MGSHRSFLAAGLLLAALPTAASAQVSDLVNDGKTYVIDFSGTDEVYWIPDEFPPGAIDLYVRGGQGGDATSLSCSSDGGKGAEIWATFEVGNGSSKLKPGGQLRFVVGEAGEDKYVGAAGGGGGSAVLYRSSTSSSWELLMVAGGGGGAHQDETYFFICLNSEDGKNANVTAEGDPGGGVSYTAPIGYGALPTTSGSSYLSGGGGGHGELSGDYSGCGGPGYPDGGSGGGSFADGGFGYGGGGSGTTGGGGGGGYTGGGGGASNREGGGGGSWVDENRAVTHLIEKAGKKGNGKANYRCYPSLGAAECADAAVIDDDDYEITMSNAVSLEPDCLGNPMPVRPAWFAYKNTTPFAKEVTVRTDNIAAQLSVFDSCSASAPFACSEVTSTPEVTWTIPPGDKHRIRVTTLAAIGLVLEVSSDLDDPGSGGGGSDPPAPTCGQAPFVESDAGNDNNYPSYTVLGGTGLNTACGETVGSETWFKCESWETDQCVNTTAVAALAEDVLSVEVFDACNGELIACSPASSSNLVSWVIPTGEEHVIRVSSTKSEEVQFVLKHRVPLKSATWLQLGNGLAAGGVIPKLEAYAGCSGEWGEAAAVVPGALEVSQAAPLAPAVAIIGMQEANTPLFGGTLVPSLDIIVGGATDENGELVVPLTWPKPTPQCLSFVTQVWILDPAGPEGVSATDALRLALNIDPCSHEPPPFDPE